MMDHFHKSGVFINPVFHAGSCAYKIETFAFRKRTKTETATCLLVMIFTKGPGPQSFKSARVFQQPSAFSFPASASVQIFYLGRCIAPFFRPSTSKSVKKNNYGSPACLNSRSEAIHPQIKP